MAGYNTTMPSDFLMLKLNEAFRTPLGDGFFVAEDEQRCVPCEYAVDVFETASSCLGVEEIHFRGLVLVSEAEWKPLPMGTKEKLSTVQIM
jgi:hypothetical protein